MKKSLLFALVILTANARAQLVLTGVNNALPLNAPNQLHKGNYIQPNYTNGTNLIWDFTTLDDSGLVAENPYLSCAQANAVNCSYFAGSNVIKQNQNGAGYYDYFISDSTRIALKGSEAPQKQILYADPEDRVRFPFTLNDSYHDTKSGTYFFGGATHQVFGEIYVSGIGTGTLMLPGKTYTDALLVERNWDEIDTIVGAHAGVQNIAYTSLDWYVSSKALPVLSLRFQMDLLAGTPPVRYSLYERTAVAPTGISNPALNSAGLITFPNPAGGIINVEYNLEKPAAVELSLSDISGRLLYHNAFGISGAGPHRYGIGTAGISSGLYFLRIIVDGQAIIRKVQVQGNDMPAAVRSLKRF